MTKDEARVIRRCQIKSALRNHLRTFRDSMIQETESYVRVIRKRIKGSYFAKMILIAK